MTLFFFLLILLGMYVFKFAALASVKRSPFKATSTAFLNGMGCKYTEPVVERAVLRPGNPVYSPSSNFI
jgi:hypothetical protein